MRKIISWLDTNVLFVISGFLLAFIPLYPKLPLFDVLPGYIVRVRIEDFLIGITIIIWLIQLFRKKITFGPNPLSKQIGIYLLVGLFSMFSAVFITHTVPFELLHIGKMGLHFVRRIEYFSLFFIFFSSIKNLKQVKVYIGIFLMTMLAVMIYGYGQKYLYWPAFSTMNREFAKGLPVYLTEHARVLSTFGGHYDLAAFTMIGLVVFWSLFFAIKKTLAKISIIAILAGSFWLLILTASRTSFIAYLGGLFILFFLWAFKKGIRWSFIRYVVITTLSIIVMLSFGDLSNRFTSLLKIDRRIEGIKSLVLKPFGKPPTEKAVFLENNINAVTSVSDEPPTPVKPNGKKRPDDVFEDIPEGYVATGSSFASVSAVPRTYSDAALVYDLSTGIRLDALWPNAIAGFLKNPLLGSGYSTLNKKNVQDFTFAESTDNDYLRALGETGFLGFVSFYFIVASIIWVIFRSFARVKDTVFFGFLAGFLAAVFALLANAVYIDIFEASKIAMPFWAIAGIALGGIRVLGADFAKKAQFPTFPSFRTVLTNTIQRTKQFVIGNKFPLLVLIILATIVRFHRINEPLADWHSWRQADTSAVTRNFVRHGINVLYPTYMDLSSIPSGLPNPRGLRMVEFPLYNVFATVVDKIVAGPTVEYSGRLTSILASLGTLSFLYFLIFRYFGKRTAILTGFFFAVLPFNIYYSRVILPEPTMLFFATGLVYFFDRWIHDERFHWYILAVIFASASLLVKPTAAFMALPLAYLVFRKWGWGAFKKPLLYIFVVLAVAPFFWWRWWIAHFPEGIPAYTWLFNKDGIRFKGAFFWWLFGERIAKLLLGFWGLPLLILGILMRPKKEGWVFHWWLVGSLLYLFVFAGGNITHDYYQIMLVPIFVIFLAKGTDSLLSLKDKVFPNQVKIPVVFTSVILMLALGWYQVRDYFNINHPEIVEAGREFDRVVPNDKVTVIAPYDGDTAFLYQTGRDGWPIMEGTIDEMIDKGAHYYISVKDDTVTREIVAEANKKFEPRKGFKIITQASNFVIVQLVHDKDLPKN